MYLRVLILVAVLAGSRSTFADEFDVLRVKWRDMLTEGTNSSPSDPLYAGWISSIGSMAQNRLKTLNTNALRTNLWSDLNRLATVSGDITGTYERIRTMAMGYAVRGSIMETNAALRSAITNSLDWMHANFYNQGQSEYDNFFDWEIGTPLNLNDITVLMYGNLTGAQIVNYMNAVDHFTPVPNLTGANRVWQAAVVAVRGALVKSGAKILSAQQSLSDVFPYVAAGDGFYPDGSFVFHDHFSYNGGYGAQLIETMGPLMQWLAGSSWAVTDPMQTNLFRWIHDSFEPFLYKGALMQMVSGRYYTRRGDDHVEGSDVMASILRVAQFAPAGDAAAFKSSVKSWIAADSYRNFVDTQVPPFNVWAQQVMNDTNIAPAAELVRHYQFPQMDRAVHLRPGWGFALAMSSSRVANYEAIRGENHRGWYTGEGMTYLYNADLAHYADGFWPTVNPYRLPGTTVDNQTRTNGSGQEYLSPDNWVGGASLQNLYGVSGQQLNAWNSTLSAKKSWFMFDNEVVCLGAGISSTDNRAVETIVENRRLSGYGNNTFTVNGVVKPGSVGWSEAMVNTSWAHLMGNVPGADIGFFFPQAATVQGLREARVGSLSDLNTTYGSTNRLTRNFLTLSLPHGANPSGATYAYALLPNQTAAQMASYAASPDIVVLTNSSNVQGVRETALGITAVNFWRDTNRAVGGITVDRKASVIMRNDGTFLEVGLCDPTQTNTGVINLEITNVTAAATLSVDAGVTVVQLSPSIKLAVNVNGLGGQTLHARFFVGPVQTITLAPVADAHVQNGDTNLNLNFGTSQTLAVKLGGTNQSRETFLRFEMPPAPGVVLGATLRLFVTSSQVPISHAVAFVTNNAWTETGITWNNKPASGLPFANWLVSSQQVSISVLVTELAQQAVAGDGKLSLRLSSVGTPTANSFTAYAAKEAATAANWPQLTLSLLRIPPTIVLSNMSGSAVFDAPATVTLAASVQDSDSTVTNVSFYSNSTKVAQFTAAPYSQTFSNLGVGQYSFTAVIADQTGLMSTSAPVAFAAFNPEPPGLGAGLLGEYYTNQNLTGLVLTRLDPTLNFFWGLSSPAASIPVDRFSVRWSGRLQARRAGVHTFHTVSDEGVRLWINGQLLIDNWAAHTNVEDARSISLLPGQYYDLLMEYYESTSNAVARLFWTQPGGVKEIIPQAQMYPADSGLRAVYFSGTNLTNQVLTRIDDAVNFFWGSSSPDPGLLAGSFSARWTGKVRANQSGSYTFYTLSEGGVRLWVGGQLVINNWTVHPATENSGGISLTSGQYSELTMEYFNTVGDATAVLMWAPPGEAKSVISESNLTPHQNNNPPVLAQIPNLVATRSSLVSYMATTADPDAPPQSLTFALDPGAPVGASIHSGSGLFSWTPGPAQALGAYNVTVRVTDSGAPVMTDAQIFSIILTTTPIMGIAPAGGGAVLSWPANAGLFQLYSATNMSSPVTWTRTTNVPMYFNGEWVVLLTDTTNRTQFYRLQAP